MSEQNKKRKTVPHLYNLNFDPQLSGRIVYFVEAGKVTVGNSKGEPCAITLMGPRQDFSFMDNGILTNYYTNIVTRQYSITQ